MPVTPLNECSSVHLTLGTTVMAGLLALEDLSEPTPESFLDRHTGTPGSCRANSRGSVLDSRL
jgi:hypothetical protein